MQQSPLNNANKLGSIILSNASTPSEKAHPSEKAFHFSHIRNFRPSLDSQLSTSSGSPNMSPLNSRTGSYHDSGDFSTSLDEPNARFPILVQSKIAKLKTKLNAAKKREQDIQAADVPVNEEKEESEKEIHFLKKLPVVADAEEFNVKKTHLNRLRGRDMVFDRELNRCRSTEASFFLDSVQEDKDEDEVNTFKQRKKIDEWNWEDHNEFNQSDKAFTERKPRRKYSLQFKPQDSIQEEQEKVLIPHFQSLFLPYTNSNSSYHGSLHSSPGPKLKVDELDFKEFKDKKIKSKEEDDAEVIDPIMEETEERNTQIVDNKEYQAAKHKLNEEREFMKKVIKGELMDENNSSFSKIGSERDYSYVGSGVIEEIIEEERNESLQN